MRRTPAAAAWAVTLFLVVSARAAPGFGVGFEARSWHPTLDGKVTVDTDALPGTRIDADRDLDVDEKESVLDGEVWFRIFSNRFNFSWVRLENEGRKTLTQSLTFDGKTYTAGDTVTSEFNLEVLDGTYERPIPFIGDWGFASLNILLGAKLIDFEGELNSTALGRTSEDVKAPVPQVGASFRAGWEPVELYLSAKGVAIDVQDVSGHMLDLRGEVGVGRLWGFALKAGYRYLGFAIESDDAEIDLSYAGPYGAISWEF